MWHEQKLAFETFIRILENSLKKWAKFNYLPKEISDELEKSVNILIQIDKNIFNLNIQESKLKELITFIAINSQKPLSQKIEKRIMGLKVDIEREQSNI